MTFSEAKRLSLLKWEFLKKFDYLSDWHSAIESNFPELENLDHYCGFCEKYFGKDDCKKCQLYISGNGCLEQNGIYFNWRCSKLPIMRRKYATDMYNLILSLEEQC